MLTRKTRPAEADPDPEPATIPLPPLPSTEAEVNADLILIDQQRAEAQAVINGATAAEEALLERDAPNYEFRKLDMRVKNARRMLRRLELREEKIVAIGRDISNEAKERRWQAYLAEFRKRAETFATLAQALERQHAEIWAAINAAHREGFGGIQAPPFMPPPNIMALTVWPNWIAGVRGPSINRPPVDHLRPAEQRLWNVRFPDSYYGPIEMNAISEPIFTGYQRGQEAGFPPWAAHWLVDRGIAEFVDRAKPLRPQGLKRPRLLPPDPKPLGDLEGWR